MYKISEASNYKNLNSKTDLILLIRERAKSQCRDMKKYTHKKLKSFTKAQLFCVYGNISKENK